MGLFKSKYEKALDDLILKINMNMSNNYKDNAQENLKDFELLLQGFIDDGYIKGASRDYYESQLGIYRQRLQNFTHKDQKPYWT